MTIISANELKNKIESEEKDGIRQDVIRAIKQYNLFVTSLPWLVEECTQAGYDVQEMLSEHVLDVNENGEIVEGEIVARRWKISLPKE